MKGVESFVTASFATTAPGIEGRGGGGYHYGAYGGSAHRYGYHAR